MGTVSNFALRYLVINAQRSINTRQCILPAVRAFKNFTKVNVETTKINNVKQLFLQKPTNVLVTSCMKYSDIKQEQKETKTDSIANDVKLSKWQQLKKLYKEYWYIVVPVHIITSIGWYGGFYYLASSGIDIVGYLEYFGVSEFFIKPLRDSTMGYFAVAYALYKIFTPLRYTVTLGGTTVSIKFLKSRGYIKPVPTKTEMKEMYHLKKGEIKESLLETKKGLQQRKQNISDDLEHYRKELKSLNQATKIDPKSK